MAAPWAILLTVLLQAAGSEPSCDVNRTEHDHDDVIEIIGDDTDRLVEAIARHPWRPLVGRGTGSDWAVRGDAELRALFGRANGTYQVVNYEPPILYYHNDDKPLAGLAGIDSRAPARVVRGNLSGLVDALGRGERVYLSAANDTAIVGKLRDLPPATVLPALLLRGAGEALGLNEQAHRALNLWVGGNGVTAAAHYDASANLYAQLHGRKRFLLVDPALHLELELYPFLHPRFRRAQRLPGEPHPALETGGSCGDAAPLSPELPVVAVELDAGDVLYLPPYVFHHVVSDSPCSVSMNAWLGSEATAAAQRL
eukprot:CAMPEP_0206028256 /NCGR_PEP_ID=MMETSP1464-20131121/44629_1 /ASSEMBLY_ACC=CAM_ASM_001124 /TAXON_ID=119497 /ORGANISM="Exanthemachrysis gayraliae, Strain RCC1523" /LENGTH=311 /DNA_ID=CAMNT_0053402309 /DNA_START=20 /DNA_END=952 /DNA_ORIENTATION=+